MRGWSRAALVAACLGVIAACSDQDPGPTAASQPVAPTGPSLALYGLGDVNRTVPAPCPGPDYRGFDFWLGKWNIRNAAGTPIATSIISSEVDGCVVMEDFIQNSGFQGKSMSVYDGATGRWHQTFVDNVIAGSFRLEGAIQGAEMVMRGSQPVFNFAAQAVLQRDVTVFWTPLSEERVRQRFEASFDGAPVTTTFDGTYIPASELTRATPSDFPFCRNVIPEFRQLDFWTGSWSVTAGQGVPLGTSEVRKDLNGCLIQEDFETAKGYRSRSYVYFDFVVEKWFRSFADNTGAHAELSGKLAGGAMVMTGTVAGPGAQSRQVRVTIAPEGTGRLRQTWERSGDGGASWKEELVLDYGR